MCFFPFLSIAAQRLYSLGFALVWVLSSAAHAADLSDIRIGLHGDITRIVIESDQQFPYRLFQLTQPARMIIDVPNMEWKLTAPPATERSPLIAKSRFGLFRPDVLRVVFDLQEPVHIARHLMFQNAKGKWLMMLEFHQTSATDKASTNIAQSGWQEYLASTQPKPSAPLVRAPKRAGERSPKVVVIDPGHGGPDPGAVGKNNTLEKDIVLTIAQKLQTALAGRGITAHLTRTTDYYIPLARRYRFAEQKQATLFVSLHADAAENPQANGASIYTLSDKASDREAAKLAKKENASDVLVGISDFDDYDPNVQRILLNMSQRATQRESTLVAQNLLTTLDSATKLKSHAHRSAGFAVLKSPSVPSVLVELGYISNAKDRARLQNTQHQQALATALASGIAQYLKLLD